MGGGGWAGPSQTGYALVRLLDMPPLKFAAGWSPQDLVRVRARAG